MPELSLFLKTPPLKDPLTLEETKLHLRVDPDLTDDDDLIKALIKSATNAAEGFTQRQFIEATYEYRLDFFPFEINPPKPPLIEVVTVKFLDDNEQPQTVPDADYEVDAFSTVGRIRPRLTKTWPDTGEFFGAVIIEYKAGFGTDPADIPDDILSSLLLTIGHLYEHREDVLVGVNSQVIPLGAQHLLYPHRIFGGSI